MTDCKWIKILLAQVLQAIGARTSYLNWRPSGIWDWAFCCLFLLSQFPACRVSCHSHHAGFSSRSASTAFTKLGFCCAWPLPRGGQAEVVSARLNPSHGTRDVGAVCNFLSSISLQQKFEAMDGPVLQLSLFSKQRKIHPWGEGGPTQKTWRKVPQLNFGSSFYMFFPPPSEPTLFKLGYPGGLFVYLRFSLQSSDFILFLWAFLFFVFYGLLFHILTNT